MQLQEKGIDEHRTDGTDAIMHFIGQPRAEGERRRANYQFYRRKAQRGKFSINKEGRKYDFRETASLRTQERVHQLH